MQGHIQNLFDTYLAEQILTSGLSSKGDHSLMALARKYLGIDLEKAEQTTFRLGDLTPRQIEYAAKDVEVLGPIFKKQSEALAKAGLVNVARLEFSIIPAVVEIELTGMMIDVAKLGCMKRELEGRQREIAKQLRDLVGEQKVNFNSPVQVKKMLALFGYQVENTGIETLARIAHPFSKALAEYRKITKLITSFLVPLPEHIKKSTGRIHPEFFQLGTETGRFTCQHPNLQQIPKDQAWRDLFIARDGCLILTADYNQIELRILAEFSQDEALLEVYRTGQDLHKQTAAAIFRIPSEQVDEDQRNIAKTINFGLCYGMSARGLASELAISIEQAEGFINAYFRAYPKVKDTLQKLGMKAVRTHCSETLLGRRRYYKSKDFCKGIERKGRNTPIQGTCGDIIKMAIKFLMARLQPYDAKIINVVHDELVIEIKEEQMQTVRAIVEQDMVQAGRYFLKSVPVEVEITIDKVWRKG